MPYYDVTLADGTETQIESDHLPTLEEAAGILAKQAAPKLRTFEPDPVQAGPTQPTVQSFEPEPIKIPPTPEEEKTFTPILKPWLRKPFEYAERKAEQEDYRRFLASQPTGLEKFGREAANIVWNAPKLAGMGIAGAGKAAGALVGQIVGTGDTAMDVGAAVFEGTPLPVEQAAEKLQGWERYAAKAGINLAEFIPKAGLMMLAGGRGAGPLMAKGGLGALFTTQGLKASLPQMIAAGGIFGVDDQGNWHPREGVIGAAMLPFMGVASWGVSRTILGGLRRGGLTQAILNNKPAQLFMDVLGSQAALDAYSLAVESPQLLQLYKEDPTAFKDQIAQIIGNNLAFALFHLPAIRSGKTTPYQKFLLDAGHKYAKEYRDLLGRVDLKDVQNRRNQIIYSWYDMVKRYGLDVQLTPQLQARIEQNRGLFTPTGKMTATEGLAGFEPPRTRRLTLGEKGLYATQEGQIAVGREPEYPRTPQGAAVPANAPEVRGETGAGAGGGYRPAGGGEVAEAQAQLPVSAPRLPTNLPPSVPEQAPSGRWYFGGGTAPVVLKYERTDGQPITQTDAEKIVRSGISGDPNFTTRTWATREEALAAQEAFRAQTAPAQQPPVAGVSQGVPAGAAAPTATAPTTGGGDLRAEERLQGQGQREIAQETLPGEITVPPGGAPSAKVVPPVELGFAERAIPALGARINELSNLLIDSDAFGRSEFYDGTFPIPRQGGIVAARYTGRYETDPTYKAKVDTAIDDIANTMVAANRQRQALIGKSTAATGAFGVDYSVDIVPPQKVRAKYQVDVINAWNSAARSKYTGSYLGNISIREGTQNALDAVIEALEKRQVKKGIITITTLEEGKGFRVEDNGVGMSDVDISEKFLTLHKSGKQRAGRFGGFGIGGAVILAPSEKGTWTLLTRDNRFTHEMAANNDVVETVPARQGTSIEVMTEKTIIDSDALQLVETTSFPENVAVTFNGEKVKNPFVKKWDKQKAQPETTTATLNSESELAITYYPNPPSGYNKKLIVRLVDQRTGARLTQYIEEIGGDGFRGSIVVDVKTTALPGSSNYPLNDARQQLNWSDARPIRQVVEKKTVDKISAKRGIVPYKFHYIGAYRDWAGKRWVLDKDEGYQNVLKVINDIWTETGKFFGAAPRSPITPFGILEIKVDTGYTGYSGGSVFQAKHMAAYEAVARLLSDAAKAPVSRFYAMLSKNVDGTSVTAEHGAGGEMGLNILAIDKTSLKNPVTYALYLRDLICHELTHEFVGPHNENFTSKVIDIQNDVAHLFPYVLRIAEAVLGKESELRTKEKVVTKQVPGPERVVERVVTKEVPGPERVVEVPVEKVVEKLLTPEQIQFNYDSYERPKFKSARDELYFPRQADGRQLLLEPRAAGERPAGLAGAAAVPEAGRTAEQPRPPVIAATEPGGMGIGAERPRGTITDPPAAAITPAGPVVRPNQPPALWTVAAVNRVIAARFPLRIARRIQVVADETGLPREAIAEMQRRAAESGVDPQLLIDRLQGWYQDGKSYIRADQIPGGDAQRIMDIVTEEVTTHLGLRQMMGEKPFERLMDDVWKSLTPAERREVAQANALLNKAGQVSPERFREVAEEWIAGRAKEVVANGVSNTVWTKVANMIRRALRRIGLNVRLSDMEIAEMIDRSFRNLTDRQAGRQGVGLPPVRPPLTEGRREPVSHDNSSGGLTASPPIANLQSFTNPQSGAQVAGRASMRDFHLWRGDAESYLKKNGVDEKKAKEYLRDLDMAVALGVASTQKAGLMDRIPQVKALGRSTVGGAVRENTDYIYSWDGSGICTLRLAPTEYLNAVVDKLAATGQDAGLTLVERELLLTKLVYAGVPRMCMVCYVDSRRALRQDMADRYSRWITGEQFAKGQEKTEGMDRAVVKALIRRYRGKVKYGDIDQTVFLDDRVWDAQIKDPNSHLRKFLPLYRFINNTAQSRANSVFGLQSYAGQFRLLQPVEVDYQRIQGGFRFYSISDFMFEHAIDLMQTMYDLVGKSALAHMYTKQPDAAELMALSGMKINMSWIPIIDRNGNIKEWTGQSFPWEESIRLKRENPDLGIVVIGINDDVIRWALKHPEIGYILPYHRSGLYGPQFEALARLQKWHNYENEQHLTVVDPVKWAEFEKLFKARFGNYVKPKWKIGWFMDGKAMTDKEIVEQALKDADRYGFKLQFDRFMRNEDGTPNPDAAKLLKDYARTDTPQRVVEPKFSHEAFTRIMNAWIKQGGNVVKVSPQLVDQIIAEISRYRQLAKGVPGLEERAWEEMIRSQLEYAEAETQTLATRPWREPAVREPAPTTAAAALGGYNPAELPERFPQGRASMKAERLTEDQRDRLINYGTTRELRSKYSRVSWDRVADLGETTDFREAGYIAPEGNLIDLSGKAEGGPPGMRSYDHREFGGTPGMMEAMAAGFIRISVPRGGGYSNVDILAKPTRKQLQVLFDLFQQSKGNVALDLAEGLGKWDERNERFGQSKRTWTNEYDNADAFEIVEDISNFYEGRRPGVGRASLKERIRSFGTATRPEPGKYIIAMRDPDTGEVAVSNLDVHASLKAKAGERFSEAGYIDDTGKFVTRTREAAQPPGTGAITTLQEAADAVIRESNNPAAKAYAKAFLDTGDRNTLLYIVGNLSGWRGPRAKEVKDFIRGVVQGRASLKTAIPMFPVTQEARGEEEARRAMAVEQPGGGIVAGKEVVRQAIEGYQRAATLTGRLENMSDRWRRDLGRRVLSQPLLAGIRTDMARLEESAKLMGGDVYDFARLRADPNTTPEMLSNAAGLAVEGLRKWENQKQAFYDSYLRKRQKLQTEVALIFDNEAKALEKADVKNVLLEDFMALGRSLVRQTQDRATINAFRSAAAMTEPTANILRFLATNNIDLTGAVLPVQIRERMEAAAGFRSNTQEFRTLVGAGEESVNTVVRVLAESEIMRERLTDAQRIAQTTVEKEPTDRLKAEVVEAMTAQNYDRALELLGRGIRDASAERAMARYRANFYARRTRAALTAIQALDETKNLIETIDTDPTFVAEKSAVMGLLNVADIVGKQDKVDTGYMLKPVVEGGPEVYISNTNSPTLNADNLKDVLAWWTKAREVIDDYENNGNTMRTEPSRYQGLRAALPLVEMQMEYMRDLVEPRQLPNQAALWVPRKILSILRRPEVTPYWAAQGGAGPGFARVDAAQMAHRDVSEQHSRLIKKHYKWLKKSLDDAVDSHPGLNIASWEVKVWNHIAASRQNFMNPYPLKEGMPIGNGERVTAADMEYLRVYKTFEQEAQRQNNNTSKRVMSSLGKVLTKGILIDDQERTRWPFSWGPDTVSRHIPEHDVPSFVKDWFNAKTPAERIELLNRNLDRFVIGHVRGIYDTDWSPRGRYQYEPEFKKIYSEFETKPIKSFEDLAERTYELYLKRIDEDAVPPTFEEFTNDLLSEFNSNFERVRSYGATPEAADAKMYFGVYGGNSSINTPRGNLVMPPGWYNYGAVGDAKWGAILRQMTLPYQLEYIHSLDAAAKFLEKVVADFEAEAIRTGEKRGIIKRTRKQRQAGEIAFSISDAKYLLEELTRFSGSLKTAIAEAPRMVQSDRTYMNATNGTWQLAVSSVLAAWHTMFRNFGGYKRAIAFDNQIRAENIFASMAKRGAMLLPITYKEVLRLLANVGNPNGKRLYDVMKAAETKPLIGAVSKFFLDTIEYQKAQTRRAEELGLSLNVSAWENIASMWRFPSTGGVARIDPMQSIIGKAAGVFTTGTRSAAELIGQGGVGYVDSLLNRISLDAADSAILDYKLMAIKYGQGVEAVARAQNRDPFDWTDVRNKVPNKAFRGEKGALYAREFWRRSVGVDIDRKMLDYYRRWKAARDREQQEGVAKGTYTKQEELLTPEEMNTFAIATADRINLATHSNRPIITKTTKTAQLLGMFLGYRAWMYMNFMDAFSYNSRKGVTQAVLDNMPFILSGAMALALTGVLIDEGYEQIKNRMLGKFSAYPTISKARTPGAAMRAIAAGMATELPIYGDIAWAALDLGFQKGFNLESQLFAFGLASDIYNLGKEIAQTRTLAVPTTRFLSRYTFPLNVTAQWLPMFRGARELTNTRNIIESSVRGSGDEELLKQKPTITERNYTAMTPYVNAAVNAIGNGDMEALQRNFDQIVRLKTEAGDENPEGAARKLIEARNPVANVFKKRPTQEELDKYLSTLPEEQRAQVQKTLENFDRAISQLGGNASFTQEDIAINRAAPRGGVGSRGGAYPVGVPGGLGVAPTTRRLSLGGFGGGGAVLGGARPVISRLRLGAGLGYRRRLARPRVSVTPFRGLRPRTKARRLVLGRLKRRSGRLLTSIRRRRTRQLSIF